MNGLKYALDVVRVTLLSRAQDLGILYERKFDWRRPASSICPSGDMRVRMSWRCSECLPALRSRIWDARPDTLHGLCSRRDAM